MRILVNFADMTARAAMAEAARTMLSRKLKHLSSRITRLEVHLRDDKMRRRGPDDNRCRIEARLAGMQPLVVESRSGDIYESIAESAAKMQRALTNRLGKLNRLEPARS